MSRYLTLFLLLLVFHVCEAQEGVSIWNSSTGSTVKIVLNSKADPTKVVLLAGGRNSKEYPVSAVSDDWFEYRAGRTKMRATFASANEIFLAGGGNTYRWTRRNGKVDFAIPPGDKAEKSFWRTDGSEEKYLLLLTPDTCSVMSATPSQGKQRYQSYRAKWLEYPRTLQVESQPPRTFRFLNPMLFKDGDTHWYQADGANEK